MGRLVGKAGVTHVHLGDLGPGLTPLMQAVDDAGVDIRRVIPTHLNRNQALWRQAKHWIVRGGVVDLSASFCPPRNPKALKASSAVKALLDEKAPLQSITISTDGNSVPTLEGLEKAWRVPLKLLHQKFVDMVREEQIPLTYALTLATLNVACILKMESKGRIAPGCDADILLLNPQTMEVEYVMAQGKVVVREGKLAVGGKTTVGCGRDDGGDLGLKVK